MFTIKRWGGQCWVLHPFCEKSACWSQTNTRCVVWLGAELRGALNWPWCCEPPWNILFVCLCKEVRGQILTRDILKKKNGQNVFGKAQVILTFSTCYGSSTGDICYYNWVKSIRTVKHSAFDFNRKQHPFIIWGWFIISLHNNPYQCHINTNIWAIILILHYWWRMQAMRCHIEL